MENFLPAMTAGLKEELVRYLPPADKTAAHALKLSLVYDTDVLFAKVPDSRDRILVSAPVLRAAYAAALLRVLPEMERLRAEYFEARKTPAGLEAFRDRAIDATEGMAKRVLSSYIHALAFVLAHEMAHVYAAGAGEGMAGEAVADCLAVANLLDWRGEDSSAGVFDLLVDDAVSSTGGVWVHSALPEAASATLRGRKNRVAAMFAQGRRDGASELRARCTGVSG